MTPMTAASVYLAASGHEPTLRDLAARAVASLGRRPARVAATYAAAGGPMVHRTNGLLAHLFPGADIERFAVDGEKDPMPSAHARAIVERADVVFVGGGDPVQGARLLARAGADAWLRDARARGVPCMGVSAGSIMLCAWWADWPESPPPGAPFDGGQLVRCAGVVPDVVVDCHAEEDGWAELKLVRGMLEARGGPLPRFLGLPTGSGLVLGPDGAATRLTSIGAPPFSP
jgi:putative intracellular protease/amidase